jgi:hypothetical protein
VGDVARAIFEILAANPKTKGRLADALAGLFLSSKNQDDIDHWLDLLISFEGLPTRHVERIQANAGENESILASQSTLTRLNKLLTEYGLEEVSHVKRSSDDFDDDIPF